MRLGRSVMNTAPRKIAEGHTIDGFLAAMSQGRQVFTLQAGEAGQYHLVLADTWEAERHTLGAFRPIEPLKSLLSQPREYFGPTMENAETPPIRERIVIGVKNCDLAGLKIQDHVFLGLAPGDPRYIEAREKTILGIFSTASPDYSSIDKRSSQRARGKAVTATLPKTPRKISRNALASGLRECCEP